MTFLECGDCTACCDGNLIGDSFGIKFGNNKPCTFLINKKCTVYDFRPHTCKKYQCAWTQGLFPEWMKPNHSGVLVSVENDHTGKQYLKVVIIPSVVTDKRAIPFLDEWVEQNNTYYVIAGVRNETEYRIGVEEIRRVSQR